MSISRIFCSCILGEIVLISRSVTLCSFLVAVAMIVPYVGIVNESVLSSMHAHHR